MTGRRRRGQPSDWVLALDVSRSAKRLRSTFPASTEFNQVGVDTGAVSDPQAHCVSQQISADPSKSEISHRTGNDLELRGTSRPSAESDEYASNPGLDIPEDGITNAIELADPQEERMSALIALSEERNVTNETVAEHGLTLTSSPRQTPPNPCHQIEATDTHVDISAERMTHVHDGTQSCTGCMDATNTIEHNRQRVTAPRISEKLPDVMALTERRRKWEFRFNLTALIAVVGSVRFTVHQYNYMRDVLKDVSSNPDDNWPPYSKTQLHFKDIIAHCLPDSRIVYFPRVEAKDSSFTGSRNCLIDPALDPRNGGEGNEQGNSDTERVRIFLPSAWARLDVATSVVFDDMYPDATDAELNSVNIYPIVCDRSSVTSACDSIMIKHRGHCVPCGPGSEIEVTGETNRDSGPRISSALRMALTSFLQ